MSVLINCKEMALMKAFDDSGKTGSDKVNHSFIELQQAIIKYIQKIPGNDRCCDCNSQNGKIYGFFFVKVLNLGENMHFRCYVAVYKFWYYCLY